MSDTEELIKSIEYLESLPDNREKQVILDLIDLVEKHGDEADRLRQIYEPKKIKPVVYNASHEDRYACAKVLFYLGLSIEEVNDIFARGTDYDSELALFQLEHIRNDVLGVRE